MRVAHGFAHASFLAASAAYIADLAPPHRRGEIIGIYATSNIVAMALFPAWGTAIIKGPGHFPYLFVVSAITAAAGFLAATGLGEVWPRADHDRVPTDVLAVGTRREVLIPSLALFTTATSYGAVVTFLPLYAPQRSLADD